MTQPVGVIMTDEKFEDAMQRCLTAIDVLPETKRAELLELVDQTRHRHEQIKQSARQSRDAVDDWRLWLKYNLFDADAHEREANPPSSPDADPPVDH